jgi:hypothetical protein
MMNKHLPQCAALFKKMAAAIVAAALLIWLMPGSVRTARALTEYNCIAGVPYRISLVDFFGSGYALGSGHKTGFVEPYNGDYSDYGDIKFVDTGAEVVYGPQANQYTSSQDEIYFTGKYEGIYGSMFMMNTEVFEQVWFHVVDLSPRAATGSASSVTPSAATLNATVNATGYDSAVTFEFGTSTSYGSTLSASPASVSGTSDTAVCAVISGLQPNTMYHFRVVATNQYGTRRGADQTFLYEAKPVVSAGGVSGITKNAATLNGTVNAQNASTAVTFAYGETTAYGSSVTADQSPVTGLSATPVSAGISDLKPNTLYHFQVSGTNSAGTQSSGDAEFTTAKSAPAASTGSAGSITPTAATLAGTVNASNETTTVTFEYGTTGAYGQRVSAAPGTLTGTENTQVSATLSDLEPNTTYHYRVVAVNPTGTTVGEDGTFITPLKPAVALTADTSGNDVDHPLEITFTANADFEGRISGVAYGGTALASGTDYTVSSGKITLEPAGGSAVLQTSGSGMVQVAALGYDVSSVTQAITAGAAATLEVAVQPVPGAFSGDAFAAQPVVTLKDQYGNVCLDGSSASQNVTASAAAGTGTWTIGGTVTKAAVNGTASFTDLTCSLDTPGTGKLGFAAGLLTAQSESFAIPLKAATALTADSADNDVDHPLEITFAPNADFEGKITGVTFGGAALAAGTDYEVASGKITLKPAGGNAFLQTSGSAAVTVAATGYNDSTVSQTTTAGAAAVLEVTVQPVPGELSGNAFTIQPVITLKDQYGNVCANGPSAAQSVTASAAAGTGTWIIGGTAAQAAVNGVASFTDLTCSLDTPGTGKVGFATGSVTAQSESFAIPLKAAAALTADTADNSVDNPLEITFAPNADFEGKITGITYGSAALTAGTDYEVASGKIILKPAGGNAFLQTPGAAAVTVTATGYNDSEVTQPITAGAVAALEVTAQPVPGELSGNAFTIQPVITLKDQYGNVCANGPSASGSVAASSLAGTGTWALGGTVTRAAVDGVASFTDLTCSLTAPGTGKLGFAAGSITAQSAAFTIPLYAAVALEADATDNSVDYPIEIRGIATAFFMDHITSVTYGGKALAAGTDYEVSGGKGTCSFRLKPSGGSPALLTPGTADFVVKSAGYHDSIVSQTILAGQAAGLAVIVQPAPGQVFGDAFATQPIVALKDQYGNVCQSGVSACAQITAGAAYDTGEWTIGGTLIREAVKGVAVFTDLTATVVEPGSSRIEFTCGVLSVKSVAFAAPERNSAISPATAAFDKYLESAHYKDVSVDVTLNGNTLDGLKNGQTLLKAGTDYTVSGNTLVIKRAYLAKQKNGALKLTFDFSQGVDPVIAISISDSTPEEAAPEAAIVIVNGQAQEAGQAQVVIEDGKATTIVTVDDEKLQEILGAQEAEAGAAVVIPVMAETETSSLLVGSQTVAALKASQATLKITTNTGVYTLPLALLDMEAIAQELGENVPPEAVAVSISIAEPLGQTVKLAKDPNAAGEWILIAPVANFTVTCTYGPKSVEVTGFDAAVERTLLLPGGVDPAKITSASVTAPDGSAYSTPVTITEIDGKQYGVISGQTVTPAP